MTTDSTERMTSGSWGFGGVLFLMLGGFNIVEGFFALINDKYVSYAAGKFYVFDRTGWGWIHIILGVILLIVGWGLMSEQGWARITGIALAVIAALVQMLYLPIYPFWSMINIAICIFVIYALTMARRDRVTG